MIEVSRRDLVEDLRVVGSIAPNETAAIRPEMSGLIRSIHFQEGQRVKKGDLLAKIDDAELQAQLAQTRSRHELAKLNLERAENLRQTQSNTQADVAGGGVAHLISTRGGRGARPRRGLRRARE